MFRPAALASILCWTLTAWNGVAQADPRIVYTRHSLRVDLRGLDLGRQADRNALAVRLADAADEVCGGRPDRGTRYTQAEQKRMLPEYDKCHADAVRSALVSLHAPMVAELVPSSR